MTSFSTSIFVNFDWKRQKITIIWTIFDHNTTFFRFMVLTLRERIAFSPFLWTSRELDRKRTTAVILEWVLLRTLYYDIYTVKTRISSRALNICSPLLGGRLFEVGAYSRGGVNMLGNFFNFVLQNRALSKYLGCAFYKKQHSFAKLACFITCFHKIITIIHHQNNYC